MIRIPSQIGKYQINKSDKNDQYYQKISLAYKDGKKYALKISIHDFIKREYAIMAQMSHPNLMNAEEFLIKNNLYAIAMPFAEGGNLLDYLNEHVKHGKILPERKIRSIMKQLFLGLNYIHQQDLVHRDIKLENILIKDINCTRIVLADFEFTSLVDQIDDYLGTDPYKAPEYIQEKKCNSKIDCWSAGIVLYILLFNSYPFYKSNYLNDTNNYWDNTKIVKGEFHYGNYNRSKYAKNLLKKLLRTDPNNRISIENALNHTWFKEKADEVISISDNYNKEQNLID